MSYEVLERIGLPIREERIVHKMSDGTEIKDLVATGETNDKFPGDTISTKELKDAGQGEKDIAHLIEIGAMKEKS